MAGLAGSACVECDELTALGAPLRKGHVSFCPPLEEERRMKWPRVRAWIQQVIEAGLITAPGQWVFLPDLEESYGS